MFAPPPFESDVPSSDIQFAKVKKKRSKNEIKASLRGVDGSKTDSPPHKRSRNKMKSDVLSNKPPKGQPGQFVRAVSAQGTKLQPTYLPNMKSLSQHAKLTKKNEKNFLGQKPKDDKPKTKNRKKKSKKTIEDYNTDKPDELLINLRKSKLEQSNRTKQEELSLFKVSNSLTKAEKKKEKFKKILELGNRNPIRPISSLRDKMMEKLKAAQFRYLNEKLYTTTGSDAMQLFQEDPAAFNTYHEGYQLQLKKWPINPLDVIVNRISKMDKTLLIADMGCGEGLLSQRVPHQVRSFDLVSNAPNVESCDMARTPLLSASVDVAVYCLSLMGTDLTQYLIEANRVLKTDGMLLIAEVESRFENVDTFVSDVQKLGFSLVKLDKSHNVFFFIEFKKTRETGRKAKKPVITLKPCLYKRR